MRMSAIIPSTGTLRYRLVDTMDVGEVEMERAESGRDERVGEQSERETERGQKLYKKAAELGDSLKSIGSLAGGATMEELRKLQEGGQEQLTQVVDEMKRHPLRTLAIASGAGLLLGLLLRRS